MAIVVESVASSASATCAKPTGTASGDLLVAIVGAVGGAPSLAGWDSRAAANNSGFYFESVFTRVAGGSEPADYTFSAPAVEGVIILRLSGADTSTIIDGTATTSTNGTAGSITTTADGSMLVMGSVGTGAITPDAGMVEADESGPGATYNLYVNAATETRATAGATGTRTQTAGGSLVTSAMVALSPLNGAVNPPGASSAARRRILLLP